MDPPPITEDQESTLRRWASTVRKRPRKRDKAFLQAEKGLSGRQIDNWWKKYDQSMESSNAMPWTPASKAQDKAPSFHFQDFGNAEGEITEYDFQSRPDLSSDLNRGDFGGDFSSFTSLATQEAFDWIADPSQDELSSSYLHSSRGHEHLAHYSLNMGPLSSFRRSTASSMTDTIPLLSPSSGHLSCATSSDRSSYGSAMTWSTSSTLASICDHYGDDHNGAEQELLMHPATKPSKLVKKGGCASTFTSYDTIAEDGPQDVLLPANRTSRRIKSITTTLPELPSDLVREQGRYQCTACHWSFARKGDWKRHEESHDPQTFWTCMLGEPAILSTAGWTCVFCDYFALARLRNDMVMHLIEHHNFRTCQKKKIEDRTFTRKDKLKQHLQQVHSLSDDSTLWETWHESPRKKFAWGCGYCGCCLYTWEGRCIHIAEHYEKQVGPLPRWSKSLVIKGLLRQQKRDDFKIYEIWKELMGASPNSDRLIEWSESAAATLKHKLEFNEGSARDIATEAQRMASFPNPSLGHVAWTSDDSRVATLITPMVFEVGVEPWQEHSEAQGSRMLGPENAEASMAGYF